MNKHEWLVQANAQRMLNYWRSLPGGEPDRRTTLLLLSACCYQLPTFFAAWRSFCWAVLAEADALVETSWRHSCRQAYHDGANGVTPDDRANPCRRVRHTAGLVVGADRPAAQLSDFFSTLSQLGALPDYTAMKLADYVRAVAGNPYRPVRAGVCLYCRGAGRGAGWPTCGSVCWHCHGEGGWPRSWLDYPTAGDLALAIYQGPGVLLDPCSLSVLADALEEAGCDEPALLLRLRSGALIRGDWAVEMVLRGNTPTVRFLTHSASCGVAI